MPMAKERWKKAPGWPQYEVSSHGRIRRIGGGQGTRPNNYIKVTKGRVQLTKNGRCRMVPIGALVLCAFIGAAPKGKPLARHLDDNRDHNQINNLAWGDHADNRRDAVRNGKLGKELWNLSDETRQKMSKAHTGKPLSAKHRAQQSQGALNRWARERGLSQ